MRNGLALSEVIASRILSGSRDDRLKSQRSRPAVNRNLLWRGARIALLGALFAQMLFSSLLKSPTFDEPNHLARGYVFVKSGDLRFSRTTGHPPLLNALCALPLLMFTEIGPPDRYPHWGGGFLNAFATTFVFNNPVPLPRLFFMGRLPTMALTLLLAALVTRWADEMYGAAGGTLALALCAFDPNMIAHGRLATTDAGVAFFYVLTVYLFERFLRRRSGLLFVATGVALGLAQCAKFSALLLLPVLGLLGVGDLCRRWCAIDETRESAPSPPALAALLLPAALVIWGVYGLAWGRPQGLSVTLPAPQYIEGVRAMLDRVSTAGATFLLGRRLGHARWYYFPVAFAVKTPLPLMLAILLALLTNRSCHLRRAEWPLLLLPILYFAAATRSSLNLGYRHLLPMLPFLWIYGGRTVLLVPAAAKRARPLIGVGIAALVTWLVVGTLHIAPHYLAYFNEPAGGPTAGRRYLADSNIDWGQDLYALARYARQHDDLPFYVSWFGSTYPYMYGIEFKYRHLPGHYAFPYSTDMARSSYNPLHPEPGLYAISITNLQMGVDEGDLFAFFRRQEPIDRVGYSILIYRVTGEATKAAYCLAHTYFEHLSPGVLSHSLGRGPGDVRWFEPGRSFVLPAAEEAIYVAPSMPLSFDPGRQRAFIRNARLLYEQEKSGAFTAEQVHLLARTDELRSALISSMSAAPMYWSDAVRFDGPFTQHPLTAPVKWEHGLRLLGYRLLSKAARPGDKVELLTLWQATTTMPPEMGDLTAFVHLLDEQGRVCGSEDRLDLEPLSWQPGDLMVQLHRVALPADARGGTYRPEIGLYRPDDMHRLRIYDAERPVGDRVLLPPIHISKR